MAQVFDLEFEFPLEDLSLRMKATVEQYPVAEIYKVHSFEYIPDEFSMAVLQYCSLEDIIIQCIEKDDQQKWVHKDSGKESELSKAVGLAIEKIPYSS